MNIPLGDIAEIIVAMMIHTLPKGDNSLILTDISCITWPSNNIKIRIGKYSK
jgi:hypothetical protein